MVILDEALTRLLTGRRAHQFSGLSPVEITRVICQVNRPVPASVPADLGRSVLKAMAKEPARHYPCAAELAGDPERFRSGWPVRARPNSFPYRAAKFLRRNRLAMAGSVLIVAAIGGRRGIHDLANAARRAALCRCPRACQPAAV